jgi:hypothetical protein
MTDTPDAGAPTAGAPEGAAPGAAEAPAGTAPAAEAGLKGAKVREAISLIKEHPLGAVATVAAATALLEIEFAVGVLAGVGATALLANKSGPERRRIVLERGKWALDRARVLKETALKKKGAPAPQPTPPASPV